MAIAVTLVIAMVASSLSLVVCLVPERASAYTAHAPILIDGNAGFTYANGVTGGSGTSVDPYIIEGWEIDYADLNGIEVRNTSASFVIRSVYILGSGWDNILFTNVSNARVEYSTLLYSFSVEILYSKDVELIGNQIGEITHYPDAQYGIHVEGSERVTVSGNTVSCNYAGLFLMNSVSCAVTANHFHNDGVRIWGDSVEHFNSHTISSDNTLNSGVIYYHKGGTGVYIHDVTVGQIIVVDAESVVIEKVSFLGNRTPIRSGFVRNFQVLDCVLEADSLPMLYTDVIELAGNTLTATGLGIYILFSSNVLLSDNIVYNTYDGIRLHYVTNCSIVGNSLMGQGPSSRGILAHDSGKVIVEGNTISNCSNYSVGCFSCTEARMFHNNFDANIGIAFDDGTNAWDNGYPSGGNYWSDYSGVDSNSDGIGDAPYVIDEDSQDRYPLMQPFSGMNTPPTASFIVAPSQGTTSELFSFDASGSSDAEDSASSLQVRWDWKGDGIWDTAWSYVKTAQHQYATAGTFAVRLAVKDSGTLEGECTRTVVVNEDVDTVAVTISVSPETVNIFESTTVNVHVCHSQGNSPIYGAEVLFASSNGGWFLSHDYRDAGIEPQITNSNGDVTVSFKSPFLEASTVFTITAGVRVGDVLAEESATLSVVVKPGTTAKILPVPYSHQGATAWCWANSMSMVLRYYGFEVHPWDIAEYYRKGHDDGLSNPQVYVDNEIGTYMAQYGLSTDARTWGYDPPTWDWVKSQIDSGYPVIFGSEVLGSPAHMTVVTGYSIEPDGSRNLLMHNPSARYISDNPQGTGLWKVTGIPKNATSFMYVKVNASVIIDTSPFTYAFWNWGFFSVKGIPNPKQAQLVLVDNSLYTWNSPSASLWLSYGLCWKKLDAAEGGSFWFSSSNIIGAPEGYMYLCNHQSTTLTTQFNVTIDDYMGNRVYSKQSSAISISPYSVRMISYGDFFETISLNGYRGHYKIYLGAWKYNTNYNSVDSYDFVGPIVFSVDDEMAEESLAKIVLGCPADATVTNSLNQTMGFVDGKCVNEMPNGIVLSEGEQEIYLVPMDNYTVDVRGHGFGSYYFEAGYLDGKVRKVFSIVNVSLTDATSDHLGFFPESDALEFRTNETGKEFTLEISMHAADGTLSLVIENMIARRNAVYRFQVLDWAALTDSSINSTMLYYDIDDDGLYESEIGLHNGMTADEIADELRQALGLPGDVIVLGIAAVMICAVGAVTVGIVRSVRRIRGRA